MKKLLVFFLLLNSGLVAINDKKDSDSEAANCHRACAFTMLSKSRSLTPCCSPESSDDESCSQSDESSSREEVCDGYSVPTVESFGRLTRPFLERFGGYFFGGAFAILITYKFYSAGYL